MFAATEMIKAMRMSHYLFLSLEKETDNEQESSSDCIQSTRVLY